jgi:hypothetical protein
MGPFGGPLPELPLSTQEQEGVIRLANIKQAQAGVRDDLAISPATLIEALGDAVKSVVNCRISLSANSAVPDSNQSGSTIYLHPYNGNELALYDSITTRWRVRRFGGVQGFSMSGASASNRNYDVYLYDTTNIDPVNATFAMEFVSWPGDRTPPARTTQDGILVKNGDPTRRLIGVVRTTSGGRSTIDLGGSVAAPGTNYPKMYLANLYNLYDVRARFIFATNWNQRSNGWESPPPYGANARIDMVQASNTLVLVFMDIYSNGPSVVYCCPGVNSNAGPVADAFWGEQQGENQTANSQWGKSLNPGLNQIYYMYKQLGPDNLINEHENHGWIVVSKA